MSPTKQTGRKSTGGGMNRSYSCSHVGRRRIRRYVYSPETIAAIDRQLRNSEFILNKMFLQKLVLYMLVKMSSGVRFENAALTLLKKGSEDFVVGLYEDAVFSEILS